MFLKSYNNKPFFPSFPFFGICKMPMFYHFLKFSQLLKTSYSFESFVCIELMWLNSRFFYVLGNLEFSPKQFTFVLMHYIFINGDCKALYKFIVQRMYNYVQSAKAIVRTRFQCRNAGLAGYTDMKFPFLCFCLFIYLFFYLFIHFSIFSRISRIQVF